MMVLRPSYQHANRRVAGPFLTAGYLLQQFATQLMVAS